MLDVCGTGRLARAPPPPTLISQFRRSRVGSVRLQMRRGRLRDLITSQPASIQVHMDNYVDRIRPDSYGITTYIENLRRGQYQIQPNSHLRTAAMGGPGQPPIDLTAPDNKYSVWFRNGAQGFLCQGTGTYLAAAWPLIGQYQLYDAVILEVADAGDRLIVVESSVG
jgi:hypothetical protein